MTRINTNVPSLVAQNRLQSSNSDLQQALTRLSTGLRINSGADDPAGLIASEALRSEVTSLGRAISNTRRASQIISTADSALGQVSNLLNDVRGLVVEAANSGALSTEEIAANQLQIDSSLEAINRIAQTTTFQGRKLLDGSLDFVSNAGSVANLSDIQIDQANLGATGQIDVEIDIKAAATQASVQAGASAFDTTANAATALFGSGSELVTVTAEAIDRAATLNAGAAGFASTGSGASAEINIGANNTITVDAPSSATAAELSVGTAGFAGDASEATISGANGDIILTADDPGAGSDGLVVTFNDAGPAGPATAAYDSNTNTLTVTYDATAGDATDDNTAILTAINNELTAEGLDYTAALDAGVIGTDDFGAAPANATTAGGTDTLAEALAFDLTGSAGTESFAFSAGATAAQVESAINGSTADTGVSAAFDAATGALTFTSTDTGADALVNIAVTSEGGATPFTTALSGTNDTGNDVIDFNDITIAFNDDVGFGDNPATASISGNTITVNYNSAAATATNSDLDAITAAINTLGDFTATLSGTGTVPFSEPAGTVTTSGGVNEDALTADLAFDLTGADGTVSFNFSEGTSGDDIADAINLETANTGVVAAFSATDGLTFTSSALGGDASVAVNVTSEGTGGTFETSLNGVSATGTDVAATEFNDVAINFVDAADAGADDAATAVYDPDANTITVNFNSLAATATNKDYDAIISAIDGLDNFSAALDVAGNGATAFASPAVTPTTSGAVDGNTGLNADLVFQLNGANGAETFNFGKSTTGQQIADAVNLVADSTGVTATFNASGLTFSSSAYGSDALVNIEVISEGTGGSFAASLDSLRQNGTDIDATVNGVEANGQANSFSINTSTLDLNLSVDDGSNVDFSFSITGGGALFQLGPDVTSNQQARLGIGSVSTGQLGGAAGRLYELGSGQARSLVNDVNGAAKIIDEVVDVVTGLRGRLGAFQATSLESNLVSLNETLANLKEAESSIRDADFAQESANLTRAQILVQSGTNVLSLANQNPQNVLSLLR